MAISPTAEGFRAAFRRPALTLAEVMWRWTVGATATALFAFGLFEYLQTLPVTNGELLFLRTRHPYLVGEAIAHIFRGSLSRAVMAALTAALMLVVLWMIAGAVGRIATVRALLDYFRRDVARDVSATPFPALLRLQFQRVAVALAALFGFAGATIVAGFASPQANPQPGLAFAIFLPIACLVAFLWWALNWLLSLASMFAVRDDEDTIGAIVAAVGLCRERTGAVLAVGTWTGLAHMVAFVVASTIASVPLAFAGIVPWRLVIAADVLVTLGYFAVADWLYMARLAGYVCIAETPQELMRTPPPPPAPIPTPLQTTIDRNELILSDVGMA